jgi:hypothetical protein
MMIGFLISTIVFSIAAYALNRYFDAQELDSTRSRKVLVMTVATVISFGASWLVDKLDGDAALPQKNVSIADVIQGGDPVQIAKMLAGIN